MGRRERHVPARAGLEGTGCRRRLLVCVAVDRAQRGALQLRHVAHRHLREFGGWSPGSDKRDGATLDWSRTECVSGSFAGPPTIPSVEVAAIINWYGITDVADLVEGPNTKGYAVQWLGGLPNRAEIAGLVSPLTYVRRELTPILTIHGDADPLVPYEHAVRLHAALDDVGVPNRLHTVPGGGHGGFNRGADAEDLRNDPTVPGSARTRTRGVDISRTAVTIRLNIAGG